jgi:hypothetical protein
VATPVPTINSAAFDSSLGQTVGFSFDSALQSSFERYPAITHGCPVRDAQTETLRLLRLSPRLVLLSEIVD